MLQSIYTHAGCDYGCLYTYSPRHCFNPHTHAGCDFFRNNSTFVHYGFNPHTHAGCDPKCRTFMKPIIKFQSTHPRRVWHNFYFLLSLCTCFNPHTHAGCDSGRRAMRDAGSGFNPHTHAGCDYYQCFDLHIRMFQSTHPRRVWPWSIFYNTRVIGFNPHTHAGCDSFHLRSSQRPRMFQSTHPRRVWHTSGFRKGWFQCFNPHTHAGCDRSEMLYFWK